MTLQLRRLNFLLNDVVAMESVVHHRVPEGVKTLSALSLQLLFLGRKIWDACHNVLVYDNIHTWHSYGRVCTAHNCVGNAVHGSFMLLVEIPGR